MTFKLRIAQSSQCSNKLESLKWENRIYLFQFCFQNVSAPFQFQTSQKQEHIIHPNGGCPQLKRLGPLLWQAINLPLGHQRNSSFRNAGPKTLDGGRYRDLAASRFDLENSPEIGRSLVAGSRNLKGRCISQRPSNRFGYLAPQRFRSTGKKSRRQ